MPNVALIPEAASLVLPLIGFVDGFPDTQHRLETTTGGEPLENGRHVTDHAVAREEQLTLTGYVSDFSGAGRARDAWAEMRRLHEAVTPIMVITEWGVYEEMIIKRITASQKGRGMRFIMELHQVIRIDVGSAGLPANQTAGGPAQNRTGEARRGRVALPPDANIPLT